MACVGAVPLKIITESFKREEQTPADRRRGGSQTRRHPLLAAEEPKPLRTNKEIAAKVLDLDQSLSSIFLGRCLPRIWLGHCYTTERDPTKQPAPDLFPTATVGDPFGVIEAACRKGDNQRGATTAYLAEGPAQRCQAFE